ncbi:uncharacterized protein LOC113138349 isoform X2 [Mastacembelus armatus]|uniref:uncharacterized protein LOC113138349 isoform X2 n=1 Tax=Mastacembelus armatus TaxID=205130 RepID=UPI000E4576AC|nr:uncharacterized protein LOC113138349 isoform X2 [Mastacembelus armatus]
MVTTTVVAAVTLLLVNVQTGQSCVGEGHILICRDIPSYFSPGYSTLLIHLNNMGEINSTVFRSNNLSSVTRLRIDSAGVTRIAEGAFISFQNLTTLSLQANRVTQINPKWFGQRGVLTELILTDNHIEDLNELMLKGLSSLTKLSLNKNRIRSIGQNSFRSQTNLAELDLSENRMVWVSPEVFRSLSSPKIRLHGNPWNCLCETEDFVASLKDLWSRFVLDRETEVTCENPPSLRGRPVWNVTVCVTPPTPRPPSGTLHPNPTDGLTTSSTSSAKVVTTLLSRPASQTETSVLPKATDAPLTLTSLTATLQQPTSETKPTAVILTAEETVSLQPPSYAPTPMTYLTSPPSPPSRTETFVHPKPTGSITHTGVTETCVNSEPPSETNTVSTLVVVIAALCVLLFVVCFLVVLHRRKHQNKTVIPARPKEEGNMMEEDGGWSHGHSEERHPEMAWRRHFTGVRAKSANAVLLTSPVCVKDDVTFQKETQGQSEGTEIQAEGKQRLAHGTEGAESLSNTNAIMEKQEKQGDGRNGDENPHCGTVNTETVPYLSIGTNPDELNKHSSDTSGHRSLTFMARISTWPPTATQWQARCKMQEGEERRTDVFTVWAENERLKFLNEAKKSVNKVEHPCGPAQGQMEDEIQRNQTEDLQPAPTNASPATKHTQSSKPKKKTTSVSEAQTQEEIQEEVIHDPATESETKTLNQKKPGDNPDLEPANKSIKKSSNKAEQRNEPKPATGSTGSKGPSGGASPDDETLLSGNEFAFMDLLHEVVQNNGRWTRERWKQIHVDKR